MARPQGHPKTGGRKSGTPNRATQSLQEALQGRNFDLVAQVLDLLPQLDPKGRMDALMELMQYLYPKRKAIEQVNVDVTSVDLEGKSREELRDIQTAVHERLHGVRTPEQRREQLRQLTRALAETEDE